METKKAYDRGLLRGFAKYSRLYGPWMFYREPEGLEKVLPRLENWDADGIITRNSKKIRKLIAAGLPMIVVGHIESRKWLANITVDNISVARMAAEHLLERGFKRFAYCGFDDTHWSRERGESFRKAIAEAGFECHLYKQPRLKSQRLLEKEQVLIADWLESLPKPLGLMVCNDDRGQHVTESCKIARLHVPEVVAIIGVDNDDVFCDLSSPPFSSIALDTERAGYQAAELLDKMMTIRKKVSQTIGVRPTHVVSRESTDILAIENPEVAEAVRFIREHVKELIQVGDVVDRVAISRRNLQHQFHKVIGHSIFEEITHVRIRHIARMLLETDLTISQIALALGFTDINHIARYFKRVKGISPKAYRDKHGIH